MLSSTSIACRTSSRGPLRPKMVAELNMLKRFDVALHLS